MKKLLTMLIVVLAFTSCGEECKTDFSSCKFNKGDDVKIKNKLFHDNATVTSVYCGCDYEVSYYSTLGVRRHRHVIEAEIK